MKDLENFLWDMQEYFRVAKIPHHRQVSMSSMFVTRDVKLWRRTSTEDNENSSCHKIETCEALKELGDQFLPTNTSWVTRDALKKLR